MITEDLDVFLADFGVSVIAGAVSGVGILDMPGQSVMDDMVISTNYQVTCRADEFGWLGYGDVMTIDSNTYRVQELMTLTDGKFCSAQLEKVAANSDVEAVIDGDFLEPDASAEDVEVILDGDFI